MAGSMSDSDEAISDIDEQPVHKRVRQASEESSDRDGRPRAKKPKPSKTGGRKSQAAAEDDDDDYSSFVFDGYGADLYRDEADQARLEALTELDREMELASRAEARDEAIQQMKTKKLGQQLQARQAAQGKADKRKSDRAQAAADQEAERVAEGMRSSTREKNVVRDRKIAAGKIKEATKKKQQRAAQAQRSKRDSEDEDWEGEASAGSTSSEDEGLSEGELSEGAPTDDRSVEEEGEHPTEPVEPEDPDLETEDVAASVPELLSIQVRRHKLEDWVDEPFFESTIRGCVVRVAVGGRYQMALVHDVKEQVGTHRDMGQVVKYPYQFGKGKTNKVLVLIKGDEPRSCPMHIISNSSLQHKEVDDFLRRQKLARERDITRSHVENQRALLKKAATYTYTSEDVNKMVERNRARAQGTGRLNSVAEEARLRRLLEHANECVERARGQEEKAMHQEEAAALQGQLDTLLTARQAGSAQKAASASRLQRLADVNRRNVKINFATSHRNVGSAPANQKVGSGGGDAFTRRKTVSKVYWKTASQAQQEALRAAARAAGQEVQVATDGTAVVQTGGVDMANIEEAPMAQVATNADGDVTAINIDLSVLDGVQPARRLARQLLGPNWRPSPRFVPADLASKQLISLDEYLQRQGQAL